MKSLYSTRPFLLQSLQSRVRVWFSTEAVASHPPRDDSLFHRVFLVGDQKLSVVPVLEKWVGDGNSVEQRELRMLLKEMKSSRRFKHALEISLWMSDRRYFPPSPSDVAYRLMLIYKVHGLEQAEKYFTNVAKCLKVYQPYGALLDCYVEEKSVEKAEALFEKMLELGIHSSLSYNLLMKLYSHTGQHDKVGIFFQEMKEKNIPPDHFTFSILMEAYGAASNVDGLDCLMKEFEEDPRVLKDWHSYAVAAKGYMEAGVADKAVVALKKSEQLIPRKKCQIGYGFLLTLYAGLGLKDELYRIWNLYKSSTRAVNSMYMCMMSALLKLDDLEGAEAILNDWEFHFPTYDFRVPNVLLSAYCKRGLFDKVETYVNKCIESGKMPFAITWERLASAYLEHNQVSKALETLKKALAVAPPGWKPNPVIIDASLEYLEREGDVEDVEDFIKSIASKVPLTPEIYVKVLRIYRMAIKPGSRISILERMIEDGFDIKNVSFEGTETMERMIDDIFDIENVSFQSTETK